MADLVGTIGTAVGIIVAVVGGLIGMLRWARKGAEASKSIDGRIALLDQKMTDGFGVMKISLDNMHDELGIVRKRTHKLSNYTHALMAKADLDPREVDDPNEDE